MLSVGHSQIHVRAWDTNSVGLGFYTDGSDCSTSSKLCSYSSAVSTIPEPGWDTDKETLEDEESGQQWECKKASRSPISLHRLSEASEYTRLYGSRKFVMGKLRYSASPSESGSSEKVSKTEKSASYGTLGTGGSHGVKKARAGLLGNDKVRRKPAKSRDRGGTDGELERSLYLPAFYCTVTCLVVLCIYAC